MSHNDKIKDCDAFFEVDPITRQIKNMTPAKIVLMQGDHNSEKFTFTLPRYIEGHDMAESAKAKLHYVNPTKPDSGGMYEMTDLQIDESDAERVKCSWLISANVTKEPGAISFLIEFECFDGEELVYSWHTAPFKGISIGETFGFEEEIATKYADVLEQWKNELEAKIDANRTHYELPKVILGEAHKTEEETTTENGFDGICDVYIDKSLVEVGKEYNYTINGQSGTFIFNNEYMDFGGTSGYVYVNDYGDVYDWQTNWAYGSTIDIVLYEDGKIKTLDEKFIPDSIARVADLKANEIKNTASGEAIKLTDSAEKPAKLLNIYGKTTQNGTPTPDAPLDLESVGESVEVSVYGKNLFDGLLEKGGVHSDTGVNYSSASVRTANYIQIKPNTTYTISREVTTSNIRTRFYAKDKKYIGNGFAASNSPMTFTAKDNYYYLRLDLLGGNTEEKIQVEIGSASAYEEYKGADTFTLPTPNGLKGIPVSSGGNYTDSNGQQWLCDEIDFNKGVYIQRIGSLTITGNENYNWAISSCDTSRGCSADEKILQKTFKELKNQGSLSNKLICTHYKASGSDVWYGLDNGIYSTNQNLAFHHFGITTSAAFNEWLKSNPITVYFELATHIETPLTAEMIEAYTHYPSTTILSDKAGLKVGYVADTKNYIDNKFAALEAAIISTGGNV